MSRTPPSPFVDGDMKEIRSHWFIEISLGEIGPENESEILYKRLSVPFPPPMAAWLKFLWK